MDSGSRVARPGTTVANVRCLQLLLTRGRSALGLLAVLLFCAMAAIETAGCGAEHDEIRLVTTNHFLLVPRRSAAPGLPGRSHSTLHGVVFAILGPGPAAHRRRGAAPRPGHEIVNASRLWRIDSPFDHGSTMPSDNRAAAARFPSAANLRRSST